MDHLALSPSIDTNIPLRPSSASARSRPNLSLDLSSLPPLSQPTPPSNTLLITGLQDLSLFLPSSLSVIREQTISSVAPLNSFSPLPSLRRIVCSFHSVGDAIRVREALETSGLLGEHAARLKIYYGEPTPILDEEGDSFRSRLLQAPQIDKLFFISPPPSPPHGWAVRNEDPPNKEVHADDLEQALAKLKTGQENKPMCGEVDKIEPDTPVSISSAGRTSSWPSTGATDQRSRSSTIIYDPEDHGMSPNLPAVWVEDTSVDCYVDSDVEMSPIDGQRTVKGTIPKTAMPLIM